MNVQLRGLNGAMQRMRELQSRIDALSPIQQQSFANEVLPQPRPAQAMFGDMLDGAIRPFDPMKGAALTHVDRPSGSMASAIRSAAQKAGIDPALFEALVGRESSFNVNAVSRVGALGLAQLMPKTAESLGVTDPFDPMQNLNAGARYLAQLVRDYKGDVQMALAAYNAGPGTVKQVGGIPEESQGYVRDVLARSAAIRQVMQAEDRS